ncbi:hypothetical protein [Amycolatopsis sp. NPDC051903]|uniref:hypothetical protein n=1 Tax=Amycolatopsis sp. NPDC051903 TaxID=3363936 RepID=UPI003790A5EA
MNRVARLRLAGVAAAVALVASGCAGPPPEQCDENFCITPAYWPSAATQIENGFMAVLSALGVVPIVPRSANGPARRTFGQ